MAAVVQDQALPMRGAGVGDLLWHNLMVVLSPQLRRVLQTKFPCAGLAVEWLGKRRT